jgi:phage gp29-like protein
VLHFAFEDIAKVKYADVAEPVVMLQDLYETGLVGATDQDRRKLVEIVDSIRQRAFSMYSMKTTDVFSEDAANEVEPLLTILDWVEKQAKIYKKRFPNTLLG